METWREEVKQGKPVPPAQVWRGRHYYVPKVSRVTATLENEPSMSWNTISNNIRHIVGTTSLVLEGFGIGIRQTTGLNSVTEFLA
jgi:hypothetical protein